MSDSLTGGDEQEQDHDGSGSGKSSERIGRYQIRKLLQECGQGRLFLAYDEQLNREVTVRVPLPAPHGAAANATDYFTDFRSIASLDHPHIVPIYDVGSTTEHPCFVVSKYIEGQSLSARLAAQRFEPREAAKLVQTMADALHHSHRQQIVHRDVRPGNILIGNDGLAYLVGPALWEQQIESRGSEGLAYLSPEQVSDEAHRVGPGSDIFSLGVILYQLLVGRRPFRSDSPAELLEQIRKQEARPPRQINDLVPKELERICLKTLGKRAADRYETAADLSSELRQYLSLDRASPATADVNALAAPVGPAAGATGSATALSQADGQLLKVIPKGLRSFDAHDADFFLGLVPGPRDREGLPDSLRFWKNRIEDPDPNNAFTVGLIYGPSGCGKSSLIKAGLLPRLSQQVIPIFVEATATGTEAHLLSGVRQCRGPLPDNTGAKDALAALRRGNDMPTGQKVLIVLDQFEQWLHVEENMRGSELVQALRQCDGVHLQCLILVRDDFWLATSRFMAELEVDLKHGHNTAVADLFGLDHAERVLGAFGRAYGRLPERPDEMTRPQRAFLQQSVSGLAEDGKVVCVRLALFAEMLKGKTWEPATLRQVGGTHGVGVTFLEETFSTHTASPKHRLHQTAARAVLRELLPDAGTDIKGYMCSHAQLLEASGYGSRPKDFDELIGILDREIRLITPTAPPGRDATEEADGRTLQGSQFFQLTHDYLVHSLREWLTRKQKETRRGRAELLLFDRSVSWNSKPENQLLPTLSEYLGIRCLTRNKNWTAPQRRMMSAARKRHASLWGSACLVLALLGTIGWQYRSAKKHNQAELLVNALLRAPSEAFAISMFKLKPLRKQAIPILRQRFVDHEVNPNNRTHAAMALAEFRLTVPEMLVDSIAAADASACAFFVRHLSRQRTASLKLLKQQAARATEAGEWRHKARLAIVALHLGDTALSAEMCQLRKDPVQRSEFIDVFPSWHADLRELKRAVQQAVQTPAWRSGICLAIGSVIDVTHLDKHAWQPLLADWYLKATDSGTHCAAKWALESWNLGVPVIREDAAAERNWQVNQIGMTMIHVPAGHFERFRGAESKEKQTITLTKSFWLSSCETTAGQFDQFMQDEDYQGHRPLRWRDAFEVLRPTPDHPAPMVCWYDAVMFCNWLSWRENRKPYYQVTLLKTDEDSTRQRFQHYDVEQLNSNGYRLPTDAEWGYACRAGSQTTFSFGNDDGLLDQYGVSARITLSGSTRPVGSLMCNGWGFFDMHGNQYELCWDRRPSRRGDTYTHPPGNLTDPQGPTTGERRLIRGGAWMGLARWCGMTQGASQPPTHAFGHHGFRVAAYGE